MGGSHLGQQADMAVQRLTAAYELDLEQNLQARKSVANSENTAWPMPNQFGTAGAFLKRTNP